VPSFQQPASIKTNFEQVREKFPPWQDVVKQLIGECREEEEAKKLSTVKALSRH